MPEKKESATPEVDYIVNAIEVLLGAVWRLFVAVAALPFRLLCLMAKGNRKPGVPTES